MRRPPIERMAMIYAVLLRGERCNTDDFAARLEISKKSAQRDIEFMRDRLQLPIVYSAKRRCFEVRSTKRLPWWLLRPGDKALRQARLHKDSNAIYSADVAPVHLNKRFHARTKDQLREYDL